MLVINAVGTFRVVVSDFVKIRNGHRQTQQRPKRKPDDQRSLPPGHSGSGGKVQMGRMTKRGDPYLRTLLIAGARALILLPKKSAWLQGLLGRRPVSVAAVALAHKLARLAWALVAHQRDYDPQWQSQRPRAQAA